MSNYLARTAFGSQGGPPTVMWNPFADWLADMQNILQGADAWVVQEIARQPRN